MKLGIRGFTIVELLIAIVVIAILATISIVAFNGIQNRAHISAVQSDLRQIAQTMETYQITNGDYIHDTTDSPDLGTTSAVIKDALQALPLHISIGSYSTTTSNLLYIAKTDGTKWALLGVPKGGEAWYVSDIQHTPALYSSLSSHSPYYPYPGSGFGSVGQTLDIPLNQSAYWNVYSTSGGFRAWN